ncbi:MAG: hypothetical protein EAZ32_12605 [Cytophagia bacterium]|nr:MAG: hypothetical protein EAZ46_02525 [Runella sp.]TAG19068.1 MAG: hypothetical protein EAZ38_13225 [Cytophagales bacterium]TAG38358.1 MAG: hypothetical protein EAZ32_12605 [Cytophagia bacterium]TAG79924.1 MAG: hypothetical protein EAZ22_10530 [Cytophagales bacterium]
MDTITFVRVLVAGGVITPDELQRLAVVAQQHAQGSIEVGFRQDLLLACATDQAAALHTALGEEGFWVEAPQPIHPNIVSSVVAQNIFDKTSWLRSGDYLDILDSFDFKPRLKVNLIDPAQELIRPLTGELNFIAAAHTPQFWYLVVKFPEWDKSYVWNKLIDGEEIAQWVHQIERHWFEKQPLTFDELCGLVNEGFGGRTRPLTTELKLTPKPYPHHEGIYRYDDRYWAGLYVREGVFKADFLQELCALCIKTKIGRLYPTPFKTFIVRDIPKETIYQWDRLLGLFGVHTHYSSLELNWQIPDADAAAIALKVELTEAFERIKIRTSSLSFSIGTRSPDTTSTIVIEPLDAHYQAFRVVYSPNFFIGNSEWHTFAEQVNRADLPETLRQLTLVYYQQLSTEKRGGLTQKSESIKPVVQQVWQCRHCLTIAEHTTLPLDYQCSMCDALAIDFGQIEMSGLIFSQ